MLVTMGVVVYVIIVAGFISFGRFLKDCDATLFKQLKADPFTEEPAN